MHSLLTLRSVTDIKSVALLPYAAAPTSFVFVTRLSKKEQLLEKACANVACKHHHNEL